MSTINVTGEINQYLERMRKALNALPSADRDEIVEEIRSHILERMEAEGHTSEQSIREILQAVGDPDELASEYKTEAMLRRAVTSISPWVLLRSMMRWAMTGFAGFIAFVLTLTGYACAAVCYLCGLLKPVFPTHIGLWLTPDHMITLGYRAGNLSPRMYGISVKPPISFVLGTLGPAEGPARELLGPWLFPFTLLCGVIFVFVTTRFARWLIKKFGQRKSLHALSLAHART